PTIPATIGGIGVGAVLSLIYADKTRGEEGRSIALIIIIAAILLSYICVLYEVTFGDFDYGSILFHLQHGFDNAPIELPFKKTIRFMLSAIFGILAVRHLCRNNLKFRNTAWVYAAALILLSPVGRDAFRIILNGANAGTVS